MDEVSQAALYGRGIFTTVAVFGGEPFLWEKHWRRLTGNAAKIGLGLSDHSEERSRCALDAAIAGNDIFNGRARITFFDGSPAAIWSDESERSTGISILTGQSRKLPEDLNLGISPYTVNSRS